MPGEFGFLAWIIIGGLAGWVASIMMKRDASMGLVANILVGVVGALLGGWLLGVAGVATAGAGLIMTFVTAVIGAVVLLAIVNMARRGSVR